MWSKLQEVNTFTVLGQFCPFLAIIQPLQEECIIKQEIKYYEAKTGEHPYIALFYKYTMLSIGDKPLNP